MRALLNGLRIHLKDKLSLGDESVAVMFSGQPPAWAGESFWSIWQRGWTARNGDYDLDEFFEANVTLTRRFNGYAPWDRQGVELLLEENNGMYARVERARVLIHQNHELRVLVNTFIPDPANKFVEPFQLASVGPPEPKGATWFHGRGAKGDAGIAMTIALAPMRRVQTIESMT